jgi:DDE superfamily endonuclease
MILPGSWSVLLASLRGTFRRRGTFTMFTILATGMVATTGRRTVVGMLAGARMAQAVSFHAACRFFSHAKWDVDRLGLGVTRLILELLPGAQEVSTDPDGTMVLSITVSVDDTLFRRWGRKVHAAFWTHCAMRRSVISPVQRGEMGGISLDPMANPELKGKIGDSSMPGN